MAERHDIPVIGGTAHVVFTESDDGDFRVLDPVPGLELRRRRLVDAPWNWIRQVHGNGIRIVTRAGEVAGEEADGLITTASDCPVAVTTPLARTSLPSISRTHATIGISNPWG